MSGSIEAVGSEVSDFKKGDEVYGMLDFNRDGAYAEFVIARPRELAPKPWSIDHLQAAGVPLAALTAWQSLFEAGGLAPDQTVLIHGAAGGVGHYAVQFAKWQGARVIGTASANHAAFLRELGADQVVDYRTTRFEDAVRGVDVVLDTRGGETQERSWGVLKKGGILVATLGLASPEAPAAHGVRGEGIMVHPDREQLAQIAGLIDTGKIRPVISTVLPLATAAKAHQLSEAGHVRGKIVLLVKE